MKNEKLAKQINRIKYADAKMALRSGDLTKAAAAFERHFAKPGNFDDAEMAAKFGDVLTRLEKYDEGLIAYRRALFLNPSSPDFNYRVGFLLERDRQFETALEHYDIAIKGDQCNPEFLYRRARVHKELGHKTEAVADVESAIAMKSDDARYHKLLRGVSFVLPLWRQIEILEAGLSLHSQETAWVRSLARATFSMRRWKQSMEMSSLVLTLDKPQWQDAVHAAVAAHEIGSPRFDEFAHQAVRLSGDKKTASIGAAVLFEKLGFRDLAIQGYSDVLRRKPSAGVYSSRGVLYSRQHRWIKAEFDFRMATALMPTSTEPHYRLGLSLERQGRHAEAASAYRASINSSSLSNYRRYRAIYCYEHAGQFDDALDLLIGVDDSRDLQDEQQVDESHHRNEELLSLDSEYLLRQLDHAAAELESSPSVALLEQVARNFAILGRYRESLSFYCKAIFHAVRYPFALYGKAAQVAAHAGLIEESASLFLESRIFQRPSNVDNSKVLRSAEAMRIAKFVEFSETRPVNPALALFEPNQGTTLSGNVIPILREMRSRSEFTDVCFVIVLNGHEVPDDLASDANIVTVPRESDRYIQVLATAKWLITDNTFPPYFSRREGQRYLNTWHGTPMKTLGKRIKGGQMDHKNAARNFLHVTHFATPNEFTAQVMLEDNDVAHLFTGIAAVTGSPRYDETARILGDSSAQQRVRSSVGLGNTEKKVILYAPTWRGDLKNRRADITGISETLKVLSKYTECEVVFRGHPLDEAELAETSLGPVNIVPTEVSTNEVLGIADLLVTDYSSVAFDFVPSGKPIVIYAYDFEAYEAERGFSISPETVTDNTCRTLGQLDDAIQEFAAGTLSSKWDRSIWENVLEAEDGHAAQRTVDFLLGKDDTGFRILDTSVSRKKTEVLLYQGSFMPNGITSSFQALSKYLCDTERGVTIVLEPGALFADDQRVERFYELDARARVLARVGQQQVTAEERWVIDRFNSIHRFESAEMEEIYWSAFAREARRLFGSSLFDVAICFEGYARFWLGLVGATLADRHVAYMHNDLIGEARTRFPYLFGVAQLLSHFDGLVSVSESSHHSNRTNVPCLANLDPGAFVSVPNLLDADRTRISANQPLRSDVKEMISPDRFTFVNSARLSPEKGQAKLLEALKMVCEAGHDAELIIVGQGPLQEKLVAYRDQLALNDRVHFTGFMSNPFPAVAASDAFVLSSDHEGQGLVLLEAIALDKPTLSTDIDGPRSILQNGAGLLVDNDAESLAAGLAEMMAGWRPAAAFSFENYIDSARGAFDMQVLQIDPKKIDS